MKTITGILFAAINICCIYLYINPLENVQTLLVVIFHMSFSFVAIFLMSISGKVDLFTYLFIDFINAMTEDDEEEKQETEEHTKD